MNIFYLQANQIIKRLWQGGDPGYLPGDVVDSGKHKVGNKKSQGALEYQMDKLKLLNRAELKHDVEFLNMATDLRHKAEEGDKGAKKFMKLKMKHEANYEEKTQAEEQEIQRIEDAKKAQNLSKVARPSLYFVVDYLANYFVRFLPQAKCLGCNQKLCCKLKLSIKEDEMRPEKSYCLHWMHFKCFETFVNTPPFLRDCPIEGCSYKFGSINFLIDEASVKSREKVYMQTEQKMGEEDDMNRLLGIV